MKKNSGVTLIVLIVTIMVIILLASFTIFNGVETVKEVRIGEAKDYVKAIYLAIIQYGDEFGATSSEDMPISEYSGEITNRVLTNSDYNLLHIESLGDDTQISFGRTSLDSSPIIFTFNYVDRASNVNLTNIEYSYIKDVVADVPMSEEVYFNLIKQVNEPVKITNSMVAIGRDGSDVINAKADDWYSYKKNASVFAKGRIGGDIYVWIPRFAYKIQGIYLNHSYSNVPTSAVQIAFLREDTNQTVDGIPLSTDYVVHPAFTDGAIEYAGFWVKMEPQGMADGYTEAFDNASVAGASGAHLMKNSEYGAIALLSYALENTEIDFWGGEEYVACAFSDSLEDDEDVYSASDSDENYILSIRGHALLDTYWNVPSTLGAFMPTATDRIVRDVASGGLFYFGVTSGEAAAYYRPVVPVT